MAIIGKLMGARPGMSAPKAAPKPAPVASRPSLDFLTGGQPKQTIPADALDRDALIQDILSKIQVPTAPVFDPTGLQARLAELESRQAPVFDPSALQEQIAELQNREVPVFDPSELQKQISDLRQRPSRDDFMSIERQLQDLRNRDIPQFDPSALQEQIGGLQQQLGSIPQFDDSALRDRLQALEGKELPQFDASGLQSQIGSLEDRLANIPQFDPSQLQAGIAGLQDRLANIPQFDPSALQQQIEANKNLLGNIPQFDDSALRERLKSLEGREIPQFDPSALQNRLAELEGRQAPTFNPEDFRDQFLSIAREGIDIPQAPTIDREELVRDITGRIKQPRPFDPTRLRERLAALESREPAPVAPAFDPSSLQERLAALENRQPVAPPAFDTSAIDQRFEDIARQLAELQSAQEQQSPAPVVPPVQPLPIQPPSDINLPVPSAPLEGEAVARPVGDFSAGLPPSALVGADFVARERAGIPLNQQLIPTPIENFVPAGPIAKPLPGGGRPTPPMSIGGPGGGLENTLDRDPGGPISVRDDLVFPGGSPTFDERGEIFVPPTPVTPTPDPVVEPTPDPVATPTGDPAAPPPAPTIPTPPGSVDPIIMGQTADEVVTDPLIRALYFGTPDQPGFFNQLQQVGANLLGAQAPGTEYDPSMTEKFFNPFEDQVVQQTVEDVLKAGEQRDIAARAQDISRGGLSAFGSRARLTADERQEALGRGLGKALAGIRQSGFSEAQRAGLSEFDRQYGRDISQLYRPLEVLRGIGGLLPGYTQATSRIGTTYGMPQDPSALGLGAALSAYSSFAPQTGSAFDSYGQTTGQG